MFRGGLVAAATLFMAVTALSCPVSAEPIDSADIRVIDGDTIRVHHKQPNVRLVGFNAARDETSSL